MNGRVELADNRPLVRIRLNGRGITIDYDCECQVVSLTDGDSETQAAVMRYLEERSMLNCSESVASRLRVARVIAERFGGVISTEKGDFTAIAAFMRQSGEAFVQSLAITPPLRVLDLGCGDGTTAVPLARAGTRRGMSRQL